MSSVLMMALCQHLKLVDIRWEEDRRACNSNKFYFESTEVQEQAQNVERVIGV